MDSGVYLLEVVLLKYSLESRAISNTWQFLTGVSQISLNLGITGPARGISEFFTNLFQVNNALIKKGIWSKVIIVTLSVSVDSIAPATFKISEAPRLHS